MHLYTRLFVHWEDKDLRVARTTSICEVEFCRHNGNSRIDFSAECRSRQFAFVVPSLG